MLKVASVETETEFTFQVKELSSELLCHKSMHVSWREQWEYGIRWFLGNLDDTNGVSGKGYQEKTLTNGTDWSLICILLNVFAKLISTTQK